MLKREMFIPEAREVFYGLRDHLLEEVALLEVLVKRLRIDDDEDLHFYAGGIDDMMARLRKIAGK